MERPNVFRHDNAPVHKARSIQKWIIEIGVKELDWPAQSPDLNPIEHLWDELECGLRARPNRPTSVPDLTNALVAEWKQVPSAMFQHLVESQKSGGCYCCKGGPTPIISHDFGMRCSTSRCPHTLGHVACIFRSFLFTTTNRCWHEDRTQRAVYSAFGNNSDLLTSGASCFH
ncbi:unnamed protein product [Oncorhynchus mykiss]|uniref:Tc1-like transposase DDE domain-containing protein n=1 Tax=Oncorhynchus mykiss TaxID=8022 RepID=A0A060YM23_ONCMY|nr:unnamed protein product [Oncorhynchus mykiss]